MPPHRGCKTNISGQVDASRMRGDLSINLREKNASLNVDQINADAYLRSRSGAVLATDFFGYKCSKQSA